MFTMTGVDHRKNRAFSSPEYSDGDSGIVGVVEMDRESTGSSAEEVESPRSVAKVVVDKRNWKNNSIKVHAHSQILRIMAEDLHLREDIGEGSLSLKDKSGLAQFIIFSRPILPASPLSGKTAH